jgi:hypothetical protein
VSADDGDGRGRDDWAARRGDAALEQAARLARQRSAESEVARVLLADFVRQAKDRNIPAVALRARAINGRSLYRTGVTGWYLRRDGSLGVDEHGEFYVLRAPTSLASRLRGTTVRPSDPPLVVGVGGRDGESMPLADLLLLRLDAGAAWPGR